MFPPPVTPGSEINDAGGAYVRRRFTFGERALVNGDKLTADEVASIPRANLHSLINLNLIELYPAPPPTDGLSADDEAELRAALAEKNTEIERLTALLAEYEQAPPPVVPGDCFLMPADDSGKRFHIIQGRQVTTEPLGRVQAQSKMRELTSS